MSKFEDHCSKQLEIAKSFDRAFSCIGRGQADNPPRTLIYLGSHPTQKNRIMQLEGFKRKKLMLNPVHPRT
jgi:hypothetical protein